MIRGIGLILAFIILILLRKPFPKLTMELARVVSGRSSGYPLFKYVRECSISHAYRGVIELKFQHF